MIYNGFDFSPYLRVNPRRPIAPSVNVTTDDVPGRDGTRFREARLSEATITVEAELRCGQRDDVAELRHMLAARLLSGSPAPLTLPDDPTRHHLAVLSGDSDLETLWRGGRAELTFLAPDPVMYGAEREAELGAGASVVSVGGNYPTRPVVEARPEGASFKVEAAGGAVEVLAESAFDGQKALVVDCAAEHCELGGASADPRVTLASDYFALQPGDNELRASGPCIVRWTERWV